MLGMMFPPPSPCEINEDSMPALGKLRSTVKLAEGYTVVKTLITDDGNLFILTRKASELDAIWWAKRQPDDSFSLYLDVPVITAAQGYGYINDFDYTPAIPGTTASPLIAVGYPDCPVLSLNSQTYTIRDASKRPGAVAIYALQSNYGPAFFMSAGQDTTYPSYSGGIDGFLNERTFTTADMLGYSVKFVYMNSPGSPAALYAAATAPRYHPQVPQELGTVQMFEVVGGIIVPYWYPTARSMRIGPSSFLGGGTSLKPVYRLSTNCRYTPYADNSAEVKWLAVTLGSGGVFAFRFINNGGFTGDWPTLGVGGSGFSNISYENINDTTYGGFGISCEVTNDCLAISQNQYLNSYGLGALHIYRRVSGVWSKIQVMTAPYGTDTALSSFGNSLQFSRDGSLLLASEPARHSYGNDGKLVERHFQAGAVHVYEKTLDYGSEGNPYTYKYVQTLCPTTTVGNMKFGISFSLAPASAKIDSASSSPSRNMVSVVGLNPTVVTVFTAGGFNGYVANDY